MAEFKVLTKGKKATPEEARIAALQSGAPPSNSLVASFTQPKPLASIQKIMHMHRH